MNDCGSVSMDLYWNYVGTPLFFGVLGFGGVVLLSVSNVQMASKDAIYKAVADVSPPSQVTPGAVRKEQESAKQKVGGPSQTKPTK